MSVTLNFQGEISADKTYVLTTDSDDAGVDEIGDLLFVIRQATGADFIVLAPGTSLAELHDYIDKAGLLVVDRKRLQEEFDHRLQVVASAVTGGQSAFPLIDQQVEAALASLTQPE